MKGLIVSNHPTTIPGFVNANGQENTQALGIAGTDHNQQLYRMRCTHCQTEYAANGSDIHHRKCPECQGGQPSSGGWQGTFVTNADREEDNG